MDIGDGHGLHCYLRRVVSGAPIYAAAPLAASRIRNFLICIFLNHPNLPTRAGISAYIAASARRQFFLDWIAVKDRVNPLHLESCY